MNRFACIVLVALILGITPGTPAYASVTHEVVTSFALPPFGPGQNSPTLASDGYYWCTTENGGAYECGALFKFKPDGSDWQLVLSFTGERGDNKGKKPVGTLLHSGDGYLWGVTEAGGVHYCGTVFKVKITTGELTTIVEFTGSVSSTELGNPLTGLTSDGAGHFWGITYWHGTVYKVNASTGVFSKVAQVGVDRFHARELLNDGKGFMWGLSPSSYPDGGIVYKIDIATGAKTNVVRFPGVPGGSIGMPTGRLFLDGVGYLWGTAPTDGTNAKGTIFKIDTATGAYTNVYDFGAENIPTNRGGRPDSGLTMDGRGCLWGTTRYGGKHGFGTVVKFDPATGDLTTVIDFTSQGTSNRGAAPRAALVRVGEWHLVGTTDKGGALDYGTVFRIDMTTGILTTLVEFPDVPGKFKGSIPEAGLIGDGGDYLWGATHQGGAHGYGTIFKVNARTGVLTTVVEFTDNGPMNKGAFPASTLFCDEQGLFWGTTEQGGSADAGTVFKIDPETGTLTTVVEFLSSPDARGFQPIGGVVSDGNGFLWGTTYSGGIYNYGTVFAIEVTTGSVSTMADFSAGETFASGSRPIASMILVGDHLWGSTVYGGRSGFGTLFTIDTSTLEFATVLDFNGLGSNSSRNIAGSFPTGALVSDGAGSVLGTTDRGGTDHYGGSGTVFKVDINTGAFTMLFEFDPYANLVGGAPWAGLVADGTGAYLGTNASTAFRIHPATGEYSTVLEFTGNGPQPGNGTRPGFGSLYRHSDGHFYGTTKTGGSEGGGTIYRLRLGPPPETRSADQITGASARLRAGIHPNKANTKAFFHWGTNPMALDNTSPAIDLGNSDDLMEVQIVITGLKPETTYYYRAASTNLDTNISEGGAILSFTTARPAPSLAYKAPTSISGDGAVLRAAVNPNGLETIVEFYVGNALLGSVTVPAGRNTKNVEFPVSGLSPGSAYSLSIRASSSSGTTSGKTIKFTTAPQTEELYATGTPVPQAGQAGSRIPSGAVWTKFGVPAINNERDVAFLGTWKSSSGEETGVFRNGELILRTGDQAPGFTGVTFTAFKDPVLNNDGRIALVSRIAGAGVTAENNTVVITDGLDTVPAPLRVIARTGEIAPGAGSALLRKITGIAVTGSKEDSAALILEGSLMPNTGTPQVTNANDTAIWRAAGSEPMTLSLVIREGATLPEFNPGEHVKSLKLLAPASGSPGHGRAFAHGAMPRVVTALTSGRQALLELDSPPRTLLFSGAPLVEATGLAGNWKRFGPVATATNSLALRGNLQLGAANGRSGNTTGILVGNADASKWNLIASIGDAAPDISKAAFSSLRDPVPACDGTSLAFAASLEGKQVSAANDASLWWLNSAEELQLLAREGATAPGGGVWQSFTSLAVPGGATGPIFVATLRHGRDGTNSANDTGVWGVDSTGNVQMLFREGDRISGRLVKQFQVLKAVEGSPGVTRAFNKQGDVAWLAQFTDGTQSLLVARVP